MQGPQTGIWPQWMPGSDKYLTPGVVPAADPGNHGP